MFNWRSCVRKKHYDSIGIAQTIGLAIEINTKEAFGCQVLLGCREEDLRLEDNEFSDLHKSIYTCG